MRDGMAPSKLHGPRKGAYANTPWPSRRSFAITPGLRSVPRSRIEMGEFAIGQSVPRFEDPRLVTGGGRYVGDMVLPAMVFGYVLRSPHAHARIRSIDTTKAKAARGAYGRTVTTISVSCSSSATRPRPRRHSLRPITSSSIVW